MQAVFIQRSLMVRIDAMGMGAVEKRIGTGGSHCALGGVAKATSSKYLRLSRRRTVDATDFGNILYTDCPIFPYVTTDITQCISSKYLE